MKFSTRSLSVTAVVGFTTLLLSWDYFNLPRTSYKKIAVHHWQSGEEVTDNELAIIEANSDWLTLPESNTKGMPVAEDVLVQRIPGDNNHLLVMAYYSKENYSEKTVTIEYDDSKQLFRDDGKGDDKKAGDGLYTAKIYADVDAFKKQAMNMAAEMKISGQSYRFVNRSMETDPDAVESFDGTRFDKFIPLSIGTLSTQGGNKIDDSLKKHSIFITALSVIEDSTRTWNVCTQKGNVNGAWTFKTLFKQLASVRPDSIATDAALSDFVKNWLSNYLTQKIINSDTVAARTLVQTKILDPWLAKSLAGGSPAGQLDMKYAPFKLTAILNRFDLRERFAGIPAGESRFTFCLINSDCNAAENFTMVVEYSIPKSNNCDTLHSWAQQLYNLKDFEVGSSVYNQALQAITDQFTKCGTNPKRINQSCLSTVRTNDRAMSPLPITAEFRQFQLNNLTHGFYETTVTKVPANRYNAQVDNAAVRRMVEYINANRSNINKDTYEVPDIYADSPFLAGKTTILGPTVGNTIPLNVYHWDGTEVKGTPTFIRNTTTRQVFSLNTCSGCHAGETQTNFTHVDQVFFGTEATLSGFLAGKAGQGGSVDFDFIPDNDSMLVKDAANRPASNPKLRFFNDILRRAKDLKDYVRTPCGTVFALRNDLMFNPVHMVH